MINIYQISSSLDNKRIKFEGYKKIDKVDESIYTKVFEGNLGTTDLEEIYYILNTKLPLDFKGHSLSVSDVIEVADNDKSLFYYCDVFGFKEIDFNKDCINKSSKIKVIIFENSSPPYEKYILNDEKAFVSELGSKLNRMELTENISIYKSENDDKVMFVAYDSQNQKRCSLSISQANRLKEQFYETNNFFNEHMQTVNTLMY